MLLIERWASRASKSAQNQLSKCMSLEFARRRQIISVIMLHPGTVDTDLSQPFQKVWCTRSLSLAPARVPLCLCAWQYVHIVQLLMAPSVILLSCSTCCVSVKEVQLCGCAKFCKDHLALTCVACATSMQLSPASCSWNLHRLLLRLVQVVLTCWGAARQNVAPEKLFSRDRAVQQLLGIVEGTTMKDSGRYIAWDGSDIPF